MPPSQTSATMKGEMLTGAEILMRALVDEGVKTLFGYPGGSIMPVYDALYDYRQVLNHVLVRHEQAAEGFARGSGEVGVCLVTSGPGATNTITGIADAVMDSTPIVVIAGQVGAGMLGSDAFQECDLVDITQPICKWAYQIRSAKDVAWAVSRAFYIARSGRPGPVVLDFAKNAQVDRAPYVPARVDFIRSYVPVPKTKASAIEEAAALINSAKRPLVLVGQGVELGNAQDELRQFIEKADMPAGCTLLGLSALPSDHPLNVGMLGMHGSLGANKNTQQCDVLIAVGMRFDDRITGKLDTYAKQAKKIHFDIDRSEVNKNVKVDVAVKGDCKTTLPAVTALLQQDGGLVPQLLKKMDVTVESLEAAAKTELGKVPAVTGSREADRFYISADMDAAFTAAEAEASTMKDEFVSVEHLFLGLLETAQGGVKRIFSDYRITKEAVLKAFGTGLRGGSMQDVEILDDALGCPQVTLHGYYRSLVAKKGITRILLSLSHAREYATAQCVMEGENS